MFVPHRIASFRDKSIDKWQRKTQVTTGAAAIKGKLQAFNQVRLCDWTDNMPYKTHNMLTKFSFSNHRISVSKLLLI
jgi:hypothetical protein